MGAPQISLGSHRQGIELRERRSRGEKRRRLSSLERGEIEMRELSLNFFGVKLKLDGVDQELGRLFFLGQKKLLSCSKMAAGVQRGM